MLIAADNYNDETFLYRCISIVVVVVVVVVVVAVDVTVSECFLPF